MPRESCQLCASCAKSPLPSPHWPLCARCGPALAVSAVLLEPGRPAHGTPPPLRLACPHPRPVQECGGLSPSLAALGWLLLICCQAA